MSRAYRKRGVTGSEFIEYVKSRCKITPEGCWLWQGGKTTRGYGTLSYEGRNRKLHCIMYELLVGPVPDGRELDHTCRNRECCAPEHLEPVTHRENVQRGELRLVSAKRYEATTHCPAGHEYMGENLYITTKGHRRCRACDRGRARKKAA